MKNLTFEMEMVQYVNAYRYAQADAHSRINFFFSNFMDGSLQTL